MIKTIYCDFDGTITKNDAVNTFFAKYADKKWEDFENLWIDGKISSMENAIKQVALISPISQQEFDNYISTIEIDDYFLDFINYIQSKNIKFVILSDGFDLFIEKTMERYNIKNVEIFANHLIYENNKFRIEFPYHNPNCDINAGMCKCQKVKEKDFCYIGDGTSDLCVAKKANILFASKNLHKYCETNSIEHYQFKSFKNILEVLKNRREGQIYENIK